MATETKTLERTDVRPQTEGGGGIGGEHRSHIVKRPADRSSASAWVTEASVMGYEVEAICGHRWIPGRDPERHPVCEACRDLLSASR